MILHRIQIQAVKHAFQFLLAIFIIRIAVAVAVTACARISRIIIIAINFFRCHCTAQFLRLVAVHKRRQHRRRSLRAQVLEEVL